MEFAKVNGSWDGGDQGLLNSFFSDWYTKDITRILPFGYNVNAIATKWFAPAYQHFKNDVKVMHFSGTQKPWSSKTCPKVEWEEYWKKWWEYYTQDSSNVTVLKN